jgi:hypothetical protein
MSKNILIIGDSWGVPNFYGGAGDVPEVHTEYRLKDLGYKVYNCAVNAGSNLTSFKLVKRYNPLSSNIVIDVVIWFHTEFFRHEYIENQPIDAQIETCANKQYAIMANFFKDLNAKTVVVGGQSPVISKILLKYFQPDLLIEDWRSELIGNTLPEVHTISKVSWVENSSDDLDYKNKLLEKHKIILDAMTDSDYFSDNCHPNGKGHKILTERIHKFISVM